MLEENSFITDNEIIDAAIKLKDNPHKKMYSKIVLQHPYIKGLVCIANLKDGDEFKEFAKNIHHKSLIASGFKLAATSLILEDKTKLDDPVKILDRIYLPKVPPTIKKILKA